MKSGWEYRRQGKGNCNVAGNMGGRERAVGKGVGIDGAGKGQLESGWEYRRQGSGSWKRARNGGDREKPVRKGVLERGW